MLKSLKLHTLADVHKMLPEDTITVTELKRLVEEHGTYRMLGKKNVVMTERDIIDFFDRISARRIGPHKIEPTTNEVGLAVWIGDPAGADTAAVFVDWCPRGHELDLLDAVRNIDGDDNMRVLATVDIKHGDFQEWLAKVKATKNGGWDHGKWFWRSAAVMKLARSEGD